jgi:hypothetical protein
MTPKDAWGPDGGTSSATERCPWLPGRRGTGNLGRAPLRKCAEPQRVQGGVALILPTGDPFRCPRKWSSEPLRKLENRAVARSLKPSAGLEPATPSSPWQPDRQARPLADNQITCTSAQLVSLQTPAAPRMFGTFRYPPSARPHAPVSSLGGDCATPERRRGRRSCTAHRPAAVGSDWCCSTNVGDPFLVRPRLRGRREREGWEALVHDERVQVSARRATQPFRTPDPP